MSAVGSRARRSASFLRPGSGLLILPPAIFGLMIQRYLVRGLTFGAIKR